MTRSSPGGKRPFVRAVFALIAMTIGLLGAEAAVRIFTLVGGEAGAELAKQDPFRMLFVPFGDFGYRQNPGQSQVYFNGKVARWNEAGYRGPAVDLNKPSDVYRIVLLGGSTTHGYGVDNDETIDAHLRTLLAEKWPSRAFEVVNLGLGGYDSYQVLERLRVDGVAYQPDLIVINSGINDVRNSPYTDLVPADPRTLLWEFEMQRLRAQAERGRPTMGAFLKHWFYLARLPAFARSRLSGGDASSNANPTENPKPVHTDAQDYFETNLREAVEVAARIGADVLLSTPASSLGTRYAPDAKSANGYWLGNAAETQSYRDALAQRLDRIARSSSRASQSVTYTRPNVGAEHFLDDCHLTSEGNRSVALAWIDEMARYPRFARFITEGELSNAPLQVAEKTNSREQRVEYSEPSEGVE